ncbi:hypothetical protein BDW74DRAFT_178016 [Aspergillus multicolor]|uniref:MARVEL domain-containing protein n=1 Tax=Aspergillus multicolor TaxID=41759 RepID=UPI003CCC96DB
MQLIRTILRALQAISAIIVLAISIDLARGQNTTLQPVPAATGYAAFCGGLRIVTAIVGIASLFVSSLQGVITLALDVLTAAAMVAGGIAYAVLLRHTTCSDVQSSRVTQTNVLLSGGCTEMFDDDDHLWCRYAGDANVGTLKSRCHSARADSAFMFIGCLACLGVVAWSFFKRGSAGKGGVSYA